MSIREAREAAGFTRQQVFDIIGIPIRTQENWELGKRKVPEWEEKLIIAEYKRLGKNNGIRKSD